MSRHFTVLLLSGALLLLGEEGQPGIVRGTLTLADGGVIEVRQANGTNVRCGFDSRTWIERDKKRLQMDALEPGAPIEVLTDTRAGRCYTRTVRLNPPAAIVPARRLSSPPRGGILDTLYPRGNLTFAGVVIRKSSSVLVLRTRTEPEKIFNLRDDTRFMNGGLPAASSDIAVNTRVFVRGGKNFENVLEAFQVIWGHIEGPQMGNRQ